MKKRSEIEEQFKWDLSGYYNSDEAWEKDFEYLKNNYKKIKEFENKLNNKKDILNYFKFEESLSKIMDVLGCYASLKVQEDLTNTVHQARMNRLEKLSNNISIDGAFATVELSENSDEFLTELINDKDFSNYDLIIKDIIKNKKHTLSKKEEKLLAGTGEFSGQFSDIFDMFDSADILFDDVLDSKGNSHKLNNSIYQSYIQSPDRTLRKNAFIAMHNAYGKLNRTLASNYIGNVKSDCYYAKIRNFPSALSASIYYEDASEQVYNKLIENVNKNLSPLHRYFEIKRKALKLDEIANYDLRVGLIDNDDKFTFDQAFDLVVKALDVLGDDYIEVLKSAKTNRWIDVYPNVGKNTGAFSSGSYQKNPVILTNFEGTLSCVFTLAHELGHSMHTYYSNKNQPFTKAGYEIFVAEVASTVNEMLLLRYLLKNSTSKQDKIYYYDYLMKMFNSTIFRQTMFAEFEQYAHHAYENDEELTAESMNEFYLNLNRKYFGENVILAEQVKYEWSRIPHFYSSFYVYKYATGLISAFFISSKIFEGDAKALEDYKKFLSLGGTLPPIELLRVAGVDLENNQTFDYVFSQLSEILSQWENLN